MDIVWCKRTLLIPYPYVALCRSHASFKRAMRTMQVTDPPTIFLPDNAGACVHTFDNNKGEVTHIVAIDMAACDRSTPVEVYGLLAHESTHIWQEIRKRIREKKPSAEFEAYTMQFICTGLFKAYEKLRSHP